MITYRNYQEEEDLELQKSFWLEITKDLPWAWKPNKSQKNFAQSSNFDPRTKLFAFDAGKLVGYMSCIKREKFIPFGYPWVKKKYEGEVREELYRRTFRFASGPLNGTSFLQRFREEWKTQIEFFLEKGFTFAFGYPIYIRSLKTAEFDTSTSQFESKTVDTLPNNILFDLALKDVRFKKENLSELSSFYEDVDFDLITVLYDTNQPIAMSAVTSREDTAYSEMNLIVVDNDYTKATHDIIEVTLAKLQNLGRKYVSITLEEDDPIIETVETFNLTQRSKSVFYSKNLE